MDPLTLTLICLAAGWLIRNTVEDVWAGIRGHESPRIARRRARLQLADATGAPTIGQAVSGRLATRIANPPERRAFSTFRGFLDELIADAWDDARTKHADRRRERIERDDDTRPDPDNALKTRQCRGRGCDVLVVKPREWCDTCQDAATQRPGQPMCRSCGQRPVDYPDRSCAVCAPARCTRCHHPGDTFDDLGECPDCQIDTREDLANQERLDDEQVETLNDDHQSDAPEPDPAPDTTRKDTSPMSNPTEIDGDVTSPLEALAFATTCHDLNAAVANELDAMANNLTGEGVGHDCVQIVNDAWAAAEQFGVAALGARDEYARHVATQADIAGDTELRDTVRDTYLDASRA